MSAVSRWLGAAATLTLAVAATSAATPASAGQPPSTRQPAADPVPPPRHHGTLRVTGDLRDGGTVRAAGLTWSTPPLPRGDRLLSFEVGYYWAACPAQGHCVPGADTTATPFAARRYVAGHADTGRRLAVTERATEVVQTSSAPFLFSFKSASVSTTTHAAVSAYQAGRPPATEFVNGTPEPRTGSAEEYFSVGAPHYNTADGPVAQRYRVDAGPWRALPASRVFYTGKLRTGTHQVAVRATDRAGATTVRFGWRVVPLPAPLPCQASRRRCWFPPHLDARHHPVRWDWQIGRTAPLQRLGARAVDIYDIDGFLTTRAEVRAIHTSWQAATLPHPRTVCYLDLAWEDYRPDATPGRYFPGATLGNVYFGYPQERWVDFRQLDALKPMLDERIAMCAAKGFDAVELDDIDGFDPPSTTGFHLTPGDAQNYLDYAFNKIHRYGMTGLWKNSPYLSWWGRRYADGAVVEECYRYHQCIASSFRGSSQYGITCTELSGATPCGWDDFTADKTPAQPTGKWVGEAEYSADHYVCNPGQPCPFRRRFATFCHVVYAPPNGFSAVKFDVNLDGKTFYPCPRGT
ncbi:MAG TPA: endo alpha-1,4 polygalactosaminidase [Streptosporangiaceae bacterium]|nr:endo alpha-1,4 polygalactosaminidase [Streptosporangiaceae bacterium]